MSMTIFYYSAIVVVTIALVIVISFVRAKLGSKIFQPIIIQPYAGNSIRKSYFLGLAFLESPLILSAIGILSFADILAFSAISGLTIIPCLYTILTGASATISIYFTGLSMHHFLKAFGAHPQYDGSLLMQLLILCSALQAPFIIFIVSLFIHKSFLFASPHALSCQDQCFIFFHLSLLVIVQFAVMRSIKKIITALARVYMWFPSYIKQLFIFIVMKIGFLQAPYIFSFVGFLLLLQVYAKLYLYKGIVFSIVSFSFSLIGYSIATESGNIATTAIQTIESDIKKDRSTLNTSLLAQILLDSRILYILILLIVYLSLLI